MIIFIFFLRKVLEYLIFNKFKFFTSNARICSLFEAELDLEPILHYFCIKSLLFCEIELLDFSSNLLSSCLFVPANMGENIIYNK
jgi:hypothetical protein